MFFCDLVQFSCCQILPFLVTRTVLDRDALSASPTVLSGWQPAPGRGPGDIRIWARVESA